MKTTDKPHYEVQGAIKNHDAQNKRFEIGQLVVEYTSADVTGILTDGSTDWNGRLAHVRGAQWQSRSEVPYGARLTATSVKQLGLSVQDSADTKIEGFITQLTEPRGFTINNHPIHVSANTRIVGGTSSELALGTHVLIHGALVQGVLEAQEVVFKESIEIEANVESIDIQSGTLILTGLPGLPIGHDDSTVTQDKGAPGRFEDIRIGDHVKVHAKLLDGYRVVATELERTIPTSSIVLQAPLQLAVNPKVLLAGISVDTSAIPDSQFLGLYGTIGRTTFFEKAVVGGPVSIKGTVDGSIVAWRSIGSITKN
jgi:hypothetical protein